MPECCSSQEGDSNSLGALDESHVGFIDKNAWHTKMFMIGRCSQACGIPSQRWPGGVLPFTREVIEPMSWQASS